jgi:hypothetical protein
MAVFITLFVVFFVIFMALSIYKRSREHAQHKALFKSLKAEYENAFRNISGWECIGESKYGDLYIDIASTGYVWQAIPEGAMPDPDIERDFIVVMAGTICTVNKAPIIEGAKPKYITQMYFINPKNHTMRDSVMVYGSADYEFMHLKLSDMIWRPIGLPGDTDEGTVYDYVLDILEARSRINVARMLKPFGIDANY